MGRLVLGSILLAGGLFAQPLEIKGRIAHVRIEPGQRMSFLEVRSGSDLVTVRLGAIRYLMEQNFCPKADQEVVVKGLKGDGEVIAITVTLPAEKKHIRLRDDRGRPLWRHGKHEPPGA